jgi:hypothetical protein
MVVSLNPLLFHQDAQDGRKRLTIEIQEELSGVDTNTFLKDNATTTLPPQVTSSLQEDIRTLAVAIETLTEAITTLSPAYRQKSATESPDDNEQNSESIVTTTKPPQDQIIPEVSEPGPMVDQDSVIPDCHGKDLTTDKKDKILFKVAGQYPGPENTHKRAEILNDAGVTLRLTPIFRPLA